MPTDDKLIRKKQLFIKGNVKPRKASLLVAPMKLFKSFHLDLARERHALISRRHLSRKCIILFCLPIHVN